MKVLGHDLGRPIVAAAGASAPSQRPDRASRFQALAGARTPLSPDQARAHLSRAWLTVTGKPAPARALALLQAQWALETRAGAAMYGHNFGGVKARGGGVALGTREGHGQSAVTVVDRFRTYASAEAGATDFVALLAHRYPGAFEAARQGDAERYAATLKENRYYTADESSYAEGLARWRAHFEDGAPPPTEDPCVEMARQGVLSILERASRA